MGKNGADLLSSFKMPHPLPHKFQSTSERLLLYNVNFSNTHLYSYKSALICAATMNFLSFDHEISDIYKNGNRLGLKHTSHLH